MTKRQALIVLCSYIPFGPVRINLLTSYFKNAKNVWNAGKKELIATGLKVSEVSARLTIVELKGLVKDLGKGIYQKVS